MKPNVLTMIVIMTQDTVTLINTSDVKISTITCSAQIPNCILNILKIGKYLEIDDVILGLKYMCGDVSVIKGAYSTTTYKRSKNKKIEKVKKTVFYNQVSVVMKCNDNIVNIKVFANGSLHITGLKNINEVTNIVRLLIAKLNTLAESDFTTLISQDENQIWIDSDNLVYNNGNIIGYKSFQKQCYNICNKECTVDIKTGLYVGSKETSQRKRELLDRNGNVVGYYKTELSKGKRKLYKKNKGLFIDYANDTIFYETNVIGHMVYEFLDEILIDLKQIENQDSTVLEVDISSNPYVNQTVPYVLSEHSDIKLHVNCMNVYFNLDFAVNRSKMSILLSEMGFMVKYKPESYSGVKLTYKINSNTNNGTCMCNNKCTCLNITFLIFQTGSVVSTGYKNYHQIDQCVNHFKSLCKQNESVIVKVGESKM